MRLGIERVRRLRGRGLISRRQATKLARTLIRMERARSQGRAVPGWGVDIFEEHQARMLAGGLGEQEALRSLQRGLLGFPMLVPAVMAALYLPAIIFAGGRMDLRDGLSGLGLSIILGFAWYGVMYAIGRPRILRTAAWIRALE